MKKFILLILFPVIISGCTLIPKKSSQSEDNKNLNIAVETNVNNQVTTNNIEKNKELTNQNNNEGISINKETLRYLGYGYYTDEKNVYYALWSPKNGNYSNYYDINSQFLFEVDQPVIIKDSDLASFRPIYKACRVGGCDGIGKDKNNVYRGGEYFNLNSQVDVKTFEYVGYVYFKDKNAVYYSGYGGIGRADFVDTSTFEALSDIYSKDKNYVYTMGSDQFEVLKGADPKTFKVLSHVQELARTRCIELNGTPRLELSMLYGEEQTFCSFGKEGECTQNELNTGQCFKEQ